MRVVACSSPSHDVLVRRWFLPTLDRRFEPEVSRLDQHCGSADFYATGWREQMGAKLGVLADTVRRADGEIVVFSDVDVRFFPGFTPPLAVEVLGDHDVVFQQGGIQGSVCAGFFVFRTGPPMRDLMRRWQAEFVDGGHAGDESALNVVLGAGRGGRAGHAARLGTRAAAAAFRAVTTLAPLRSHSSGGVSWKLLPRTFWNPGLSRPGTWQPGVPLPVPKGIVVHHANFCVGVDHKLAQLGTVDALVAATRT